MSKGRAITLEPEQLAESRLAAVVESSDDAIVSLDLNAIVTTWNPAAERLFGYVPEEMIGSSVLRIVPADRQDEETAILSRVGAGQRVHHYETVRLRKDGRPVHVSLSASAIRNGEGAIVGISKIVRDISADRSAHSARAILAAIVESSDDAILSKDLDGTVMSWNRGAQRIFGYTADEMIGSPITRLIPPEMREEETGILAQIRAGRRVEHFETVRMTKFGKRIFVSLTVSPVRDAAGVVIGASKVARDITDQKAAERMGGVLAAIVQSSDDAIISTDLDGHVLSWNPAAERLYGFAAEDMIGKSVGRIIPADMPNDQRLILSKIRAGEKIEHYETVRMSRTGRRIDVSVTVSPVRDAAGNLIGASKIARDISPVREAQRRKDHFLAVLAHELRNPLAPIRAALSLFGREGVTHDQLARVVAIAERQMVQMTRLLDDLLDVSRLATGKVELRKERLDLRVMGRQAVEAARPLVEAKAHELRVEITDEPLPMDADPVRIAQILNNLIANAAKYTDAGGKIELVLRRDGAMGVVHVSDNGIGFSPEFQQRLFTLFSQDDAATARATGGLGIGLALVREFVERHGGSVSASSPGPGRGSRFTVRLPLA
jgi:two-component system sensor histidine kinase VicK